MVDEDSRPLTNVIFLLGCDLVLSRPRPTRRGACLTSSGTSATGAAQPGGTLLSRTQGSACSSPLPPTTDRPIDTTDTKQALLARKLILAQWCTHQISVQRCWSLARLERRANQRMGRGSSRHLLADVVTKAHPEPHSEVFVDAIKIASPHILTSARAASRNFKNCLYLLVQM